jgi:pimeloyl-ACP methyl ester carboxylesterase
MNNAGYLLPSVFWSGWLILSLLSGRVFAQQPAPEEEVLEILRQDASYTPLSASLFERLGWDLPDGGAAIKRLAEAAPGGAVDPRDLEGLAEETVGYRAKWHELRYVYYGLEWDITGLYLEPAHRTPGLPTLVLIHGGSSSWYSFFYTPLNEPAIAPYLAQRIPVLLVTIPGNYKPGGWQEPIEERRPAYLLDRSFGEEEGRLRNAVFTFSLIGEGVAQLIEKATGGPVLILGHSTGGEIQFLLKDRLRSRLNGLSIGWGTGGPAALRRVWVDEAAAAHNRNEAPVLKESITEVRARGIEDYMQGYMGPMNPLLETKTDNIYAWYFRVISEPDLLEKLARKYFQAEFHRKPFFKQIIQDVEHRGLTEARSEMEKAIREAVAITRLPVNPDEVIADLFSTVRVDLDGYRRMIWTTAVLDEGHWDSDPEKARERYVADRFRARNPDASIRVLVYETLLTHLGHLEKPRQMAGALLTAIKWLYENRD